MQIDLQFVSQVRLLIQSNNYIISGHATKQLSAKCVNIEDAVDTVLTGTCSEQELPGSNHKGMPYPFCKLHFYKAAYSLEVVVALSTPLCIVTVFFVN